MIDEFDGKVTPRPGRICVTLNFCKNRASIIFVKQIQKILKNPVVIQTNRKALI